jgi:hypothetical protein
MAAEIDYEKMAAANAKYAQANPSTGKDPLASLGGPADKLGKQLGALYDWVQGGEKVFQNLSNTGNAFNNDIVGMRIAAANSRMSFEEFAAVQSKSAKDFAGLGGNVAKGGMAFTEFSKTFFDSGLTENLRQMGYTSKDLNEVLATQIGFQKSTTDTSVAGQIRTSQAAAELATEMDLIAKQTGKTRKEQEASLEKAKADGQIEAKMRLIGLQQGAEAEKIAREGFAKQLAQAEAMGTGQVFKEMFATGTVRSQEAAMQMGLLGDAARGTAESAKALSKGNIEASQASMETAKIGNMANQKNEALLNITASGVGPAAEVMKKNIESNDAAYHGAVKTAQAMGTAMSDVTKVLGGQKKAIEDEQQARHGATAALISAKARIDDIRAAGANVIGKPLNTGQLNQAGLDIYGNTSQGVGARDTIAQTTAQYRQAATAEGLAGRQAAAGTRADTEYNFGAIGGNTAVQAIDKMAGGAVGGLTSMAVSAANFVGDAIKVYQMNTSPAVEAKPKSTGSLGTTGSLIEDFGKGTLAMLHGKEGVITEEQLKKIASGMQQQGVADAVQQMTKSMPGQKGMPNLDLSAMAKNIKIDTSAMPNPADMMGMVKNLIPSGIPGMPGMPGSGTGKTTYPGGFDPNINDGGKAHRPGEREYAQQFAAQGNLRAIDKLNADFDRALGKTPGTSGAPTAPKMPVSPSAAFDRAGFKMPSFDQISIGADGMPKITAKPQAQTVPAAVDRRTTNQQNEDAKRGVAAGTPEEKPADTTLPPTTTGQKVATLDDVAKLLSSLNTTMSKVSESAMETNRLVANQVRATKAMSGNVHDKT